MTNADVIKNLALAYSYLDAHSDIDNAKPLLEAVSKALFEQPWPQAEPGPLEAPTVLAVVEGWTHGISLRCLLKDAELGRTLPFTLYPDSCPTNEDSVSVTLTITERKQ